jgi:hypothetical protein
MISLSRLPSELFLLTLSLSRLATSSQPNCACYLISDPSGSNPAYFNNHYFIDFRNLTVPPDPPPNITASDSAGAEAITSNYFTSPAWTDFWSIENNTGPFNWTDGGTIDQVASLANVFISANNSNFSSIVDSDFIPDTHDTSLSNHTSSSSNSSSSSSMSSTSTYLTLRTLRTSKFQSVAEISSTLSTITHASVRARVRIVPSNNSFFQQSSVQTGAVFGMFTYASDTQESDLEILTADDSRTIYATNQPDVDDQGNSIDGASTSVGMPDGEQWTMWEDYRLDWLGGKVGSRWWVGDEVVVNKTLNVPTKESQVVLNLWSDGGTWSGDMPPGTEVRVGIEWIEVVYNATGDQGKGGTCHLGCWVDGDEVKVKGQPVQAFDTTAQGRGGKVEVAPWWVWVSVTGAGVLLF